MGTTVYFGNGAYLGAVSFETVSEPVPLSRVLLPGPIHDVCVVDDLACVANGANGLRMIDVSDPEAVHETGAYLGAAFVAAVAREGSFAYQADGEYGLCVVDVSNPTAPVEVGNLDTPGYANDVAVAAGVAYVADGRSFRIIDVSDPADPVEVSSFPLASSEYEEIFGLDVDGGYVFLATQEKYDLGNHGLRIVDVSAPETPLEAAHLETSGNAYGVMVGGNEAYVAAGDGGLRVIDVAEPTAPVEVGFSDPTESYFGLDVDGDNVYMVAGQDGLTVIWMPAPDLPVQRGHYDTHGSSVLVAAAGDIAYLRLSGTGVNTLDVSDAAAPLWLGPADPPGFARTILLGGLHAFVIAGARLRILDLSQPEAPMEISSLVFDGPSILQDVAGDGSVAYIPVTGSHGPGFMAVLDVSDLAAPYQVGWVMVSAPTCVAAGGGFAYLGDWTTLWVVDATAPESPAVASTLDVFDRIKDGQWKDDFVYLACGEAGLRIVDVSDPFAPYEVSFQDTPGQATAVCLSGHFAYVADGTAGLRMIDVSDPLAPVEVGFHETGDVAVDVYPRGERIYVADTYDGLWILKNDLATSVAEDELPVASRLLGVYSNPFNPQTTVSFFLAEPGQVAISVFDVTGREVAVIAAGAFGSGANSVQWNGRDGDGRGLSSGTYVVRLEASGSRETRKVTLLR